jgi:hypothetical protein
MRSRLPSILCSLLLSMAGGMAVALAAPPDAPAPTHNTASTGAGAGAGAGTPSDAEAAAKHAKRTECLKTAKAKKLVGTAKNTFVKDCTASASS